MAGPQVTSPKFKLGRWLLALIVVTIALGGFVFWDSRREKLRFVEPIWSDSLAGHEHDAATGQRRKIGEVWSLTRTTGFVLFGCGLRRDFVANVPILTGELALLSPVSDQLLSETREDLQAFVEFEWEEWRSSIRFLMDHRYSRQTIYHVLFATENAISLRFSALETDGFSDLNGRNFVRDDGQWREVEMGEILNGNDWVGDVSDFRLNELRRKRVSWSFRKSGFDYHNLDSFALTPSGIIFYHAHYSEKAEEVFVSYDKLTAHLNENGPVRFFRAKSGE